MNAPVYLQKKWMGDLLTSSGRASRAIRYYQEALGQKEIKEEEVGPVSYTHLDVYKRQAMERTIKFGALPI